MNRDRPPPERIDLRGSDDPRDDIHRVVASLAQGGVVALPTEGPYALAACGLHADAVTRMLTAAPGLIDAPPALSVRSAEELADWLPGASPRALRIARRAWPGPMTLVARLGPDRGLIGRLPAPARDLIGESGELAFRSPGHPALREVLRLLPGPLVLAEVVPGADSVDALGRQVGADLVLDDGLPEWTEPTTRLRVDGEDWTILRPGAYDEAAVKRMAGTILLFVCTGNTCRSPMAEALCKVALAKRLGCGPDELEGRGYVVISAGLAAAHGHRAAFDAIEVVAPHGASLRSHASQPVTPELIDHADLIVAMTYDHREALLAHAPEAAPRVRLLDPEGSDIDDPVGLDRATYERTAALIAAHVGRLVEDLGP